MTRFRSTTALAALVAVAGLAAGLAGAAPAVAEEAAPVSWSVTPADASGPDGRVAVEHEIDPAASVDDQFAVRNLGAEEVTFRLAAADGFTNDNGRFDILPSDQESVDSGTWITLPESVTVAPGGTAVVPFTITVPEDAQPGDHAAGITASILSTQQADGTGVGVESRVGFRVMTRVAGELAPAFSVQDVHADYRLSWNPLRPGSIDVVFDVANEGNARLAVAGVLTVAGRSIAFPAEGETPQEILPGESRTISLTVPRVWPLFAFPGEIALAPTVIDANGEPADAVPAEVAPSSTDVLVWAVPWPQLLVVAGLALLVLALLWRRGRSKRRIEALLTEAREEGRRSMAGVGQG
ncbi:WxL protein peptidoglycan domain-containing protein [Agromyces sp. MMS24-K17]|uniref:WxL protein peptidoglycan domain-containing protein n=1 Tax=Agromyces sp. MMS24-K17 TaxID=3372850 RepID=UPI003754CD37